MRLPRLEKHLRWLDIKLLQRIPRAVIFQKPRSYLAFLTPYIIPILPFVLFQSPDDFTIIPKCGK